MPRGGGIRTYDLSRRAAADLRLRPRGHWYRHLYRYTVIPRLTKIIRSGITFVSRNVIKSEAAYVIRRLTSRCLERKQASRVGVSPLCDVVSSFLCHTHTDGKDKLVEWSDRSCLLLYVSARIH
jgi:hypothetical protein